jgi:capsular polysaccharide transport system permease protein
MPLDAPDAWTNLAELVELSRPRIAPVTVRKRDWRWLRRVILLAVLPTAFASIYFCFIAVDRYVSEAHFVIHEPSSSGRLGLSSGSLSELPKTGGGDDDAFAVHDFVLSRDGMSLLERRAGLRNLITPAASDPVWRFPGLLNGSDDEDLFHLYQRLVTLDYDNSTNVSTLKVQAFRASDAQRIANVLLDGAETLLNRMNDRARSDAIRVAEAEVADSRAAALTAQDAITAYRKQERVVDPVLLSQSVLETITSLTQDLVNETADLDVVVHASPNSPQIPPLRGRINALQAQIDHERATLAGSDAAWAPRIAAYERLVLLRSFAEQRYASALGMLESANLDAEQQAAYLERVVTPHVADHAQYPHRLLWPAVTLLVGLAASWMFRSTTSPARRRRDA